MHILANAFLNLLESQFRGSNASLKFYYEQGNIRYGSVSSSNQSNIKRDAKSSLTHGSQEADEFDDWFP